METNMESRERKRGLIETPPSDDCCPICFGSFKIPCRSNCGHWYCGNCILQFWNFSFISEPCKCPMCDSEIINLFPEATLQDQQNDREVKLVLKRVQRYNILFDGSDHGFVQRMILLFPFFIKRIFWDPDTIASFIDHYRVFPCFLIFIVVCGSLLFDFHFLPMTGFMFLKMFHQSALALVSILRLVAIYRRRPFMQQARQFAAEED